MDVQDTHESWTRFLRIHVSNVEEQEGRSVAYASALISQMLFLSNFYVEREGESSFVWRLLLLLCCIHVSGA